MTDDTHGIPRNYSKEYDAFYDPETYEWLESQCSDLECVFCKDRPETAAEKVKGAVTCSFCLRKSNKHKDLYFIAITDVAAICEKCIEKCIDVARDTVGYNRHIEVNNEKDE